MPEGFIDSVTGKSAKRTANAMITAGELSAQAQKEAIQMQIDAEKMARAIQEQAATTAQHFLEIGDANARNKLIELRTQLIGALEQMHYAQNQIIENDLSGNSQQLRQGFDQSMATIASGFDQAMGQVGLGNDQQIKSVTQTVNDAIAFGKPFAEAGNAGVSAFSQSALNPNNPLFQMRLQQGTDTLNKQLAARGMFNSGAGIEAQRRFIEQATAEEQQNQINRQMQLAQLGQPQVGMQQQLMQQGGQQVAGILGNTSANLANLMQGRGQQIANLQGQQTMSLSDLYNQATSARLANAQNRGMQMMGIQQQTTGAIPQMDLALASNLANIKTGLAGSQAQSLKDVGQAQASSLINIADARNAASINAARTRQAQGDALLSGAFQIAGAAVGRPKVG